MEICIGYYWFLSLFLILICSNSALRSFSPKTRSVPIFAKIKTPKNTVNGHKNNEIGSRGVQSLNWDKFDPNTRVAIGGERFIMPGDFVVHEEFETIFISF